AQRKAADGADPAVVLAEVHDLDGGTPGRHAREPIGRLATGYRSRQAAKRARSASAVRASSVIGARSSAASASSTRSSIRASISSHAPDSTKSASTAVMASGVVAGGANR